MPRKPRLDIEGALHHVMVRGIERCKLFRSKKDYEDLIRRFQDVFTSGKATVYAWVLIPNHVHLLIRTGVEPLSRVMRKILTGYAVSFNRRHKRTGHLFQNRFKSILVEEEPYFLQLVRYIHLNPLRSSLVTSLDELDTYPWSGHSVLLGRRECAWQECGYVLTRFGATAKAARGAYRAFVAAATAEGRRPDLTGGGLVRSTGGLRRGREAWASDERILGGSDFVESVKAQIDAFQPAKARRNMNDLLRDVSGKTGLSIPELVSGSKRREVILARSYISFVAVKEEGLRLAEVARALNVSKQSILRGIAKERSAKG
ncbi:MAG: transposase [Syntrophorhabdales bacterium]